MDYAMEYALMSDIYDEMGGGLYKLTPANEGLFGVDNIIDKIIKWIIRLIRRLSNFLTKKSNQNADSSKEDEHMRSHSYKYVKIINDDIKYMHEALKEFSFALVCITNKNTNDQKWYTRKTGYLSDYFQQKEDKLQEIIESFARNYIYYDRLGGDKESLNKVISYWNSMIIAQVNKGYISQLKQDCEDTIKHAREVKKKFYEGAGQELQKRVMDYLKNIVDSVNSMFRYIHILEHPIPQST